MDYFILYLIPVLLVIGAQALLTSTYNKYKRVNNLKGLTGFDVARAILDSRGLNDILVLETEGTLSDHYDPKKKVVKLSREVYRGKSISATAIAAHECGHVYQDKDGYSFMRIRTMIVPFVNFVSKIGYIVLIIGLIASLLDMALLGVIMLSITLVFALVTLPVEFDASKQALLILNRLSLIEESESIKVKKVLGAAAFTYVASLLANLLEIIRLLLIITGRRD